MSTQEIVAALTSGKISPDQATQLLDSQRKPAERELSVKANPDKRTISLYGLQRWPITLYRAQWERLLSEGKDAVEAFIRKYDQHLPASKDADAEPVPSKLVGNNGKPFRRPAKKSD